MKVGAVKNQISFKADKFPKYQAKYINQCLLSSESADIFCHTSTDEDAFNSAKIMYEYLQERGIKPRIICNNAEKNYGYDTEKYDIVDLNNIDKPVSKAENAICIDFSDPARIRSKTLEYLNTYPKENIYCIDHHYTSNPIVDSNIIDKSYSSEPKIQQIKNGYIDTTAKSAASVLVRFFDAINTKMTPNQQIYAYCAMADDMNKDKFVEISENKIIKLPKLDNCKNAKEVFEKIEKTVSPDKKSEIAEHLDILSNLTPKEKKFRKDIYNKIQITPNKKFAYLIIPPDDKIWESLGGDNNTTRKILRDFRTRILEHKSTDEFVNENLLNELKDVEAAAVFYPDLKSDRYRISIHTNKDYALKIINTIKENIYSQLNAGGHENRAGGSIDTLDKDKCAIWADNFIYAGQNLIYS